MTHGSLFTGVGGFDLAAQRMGWINIFQVEIDKYCQKLLKQNFGSELATKEGIEQGSYYRPSYKKIVLYEDIKKFDGTRYKGAIDVLSGGFPCQPYSKAGSRKGSEDYRALWPENFRIIKEIKPPWVVGENVTGIQTMDLAMVLASLENEGYQAEIFNIPASAVGAWHRRERIWIVAYNSSYRQHSNESSEGCNINQINPIKSENSQSSNLNSESIEGYSRHEYTKEIWMSEIGRDGQSYWSFPWHEVAPGFCRSNDGVSDRMDRIKALGNAIVPQVAFEIFKAIEAYDQTTHTIH